MRYKHILTIILSLISILPLASQTTTKTDLKNRLTDIAKQNHLPTLSVLVKSPKVNLDFKYQAKDKGISPVINYGVASTTKFLSAILVLKQIEENKLKLDDSISIYIDSSDFPQIPWFKSITLKNLLNHTSGISDYTQNPNWINLIISQKPPRTYGEKIALANGTDLQFGQHAYSNTNYVILERIIEKISGKDAKEVFNDFYKSIVIPNISFPPADNNQTFFAQAENSVTNISTWEECYGFEGGAFCTTEDLSVLHKKVFVEKTVLNQNSLDLFSTWTDVNKYKINYGFAQMTAYGLGLMKYEFNGRTFLGHAGSSLKYQCFAFIEPSTGMELILQTNCSGKYYNNAFFIHLIGEIIKDL